MLACVALALPPFAIAQDKPKADKPAAAKTATKPAEKKDAKKEPTEAQKKQQERMKDCNDRAPTRKATSARNS
jgi:hypothetical protein